MELRNSDDYYLKDSKKFEQKSLSLDKLHNLNNEPIYDTVPFTSSSSSSSSSSSPSSSASSPSLRKQSSNNQFEHFHHLTLNNSDHVS
ncbi:unnamed protein product [Schistosoma turkestanicum]|nr:unnamed protein product [Schistosoma turkestanicum]